MATMRDHAIQIHNETADDCDKMAACFKGMAKCSKSMAKADGLDDDQKQNHADMGTHCEKAAEHCAKAADRHREHAKNLGKTAGDDLTKIVPDAVKVINSAPGFGLGGQLVADAAKVTMVLRTGQRNPDTVDVDSEFQHMVKTEG
jgi:hypothetical protein